MLLLKHGRVWVCCELKPSDHPYTSKPVFLGWSHAGADSEEHVQNCRGSSLSLTVSQVTRLGCVLRTYCVRQLKVKILEVSDFLIGPFIRFFYGLFGRLYRHVKENSMREFRHWGCAQGLADMQFRRKKTVTCSKPCRYAV